MKQARLVVLLAAVLASAASVHADVAVMGLAPAQRPEGAPWIDHVNHTGDWYSHALRGVDQPYPHSLRFLEDQGNWHTPFNRPGMTGRYDIRGWYQQ